MYISDTMNTDVLESGFTVWDDEKNGFHYDTNTCSNAPCGHYTQVSTFNTSCIHSNQTCPANTLWTSHIVYVCSFSTPCEHSIHYVDIPLTHAY